MTLPVQHLFSEQTENPSITLLKQLFPQCFDKNGAFLPEKMVELMVSSGGDVSREAYSLNWLGKSYARYLRDCQPTTLLSEDQQHNSQPQNQHSQNLLIKGDNLEVLKHLKNAYANKVKMIYIDPPYNTGSDGFVYQDDRKFSPEQLAKLANMSIDEAKRVLDFTAKKSNSHSAWLTFMYPRLYIARELLKEDGVIFISIDDNEQAQLKLLCDEVFGEENFLVSLYIQVRYAGKTLAEKNDFQKLIEHVLVYQKSNTYQPIKEVEEYSIHKFCWEITEKTNGTRTQIGGKEVDIFYPNEYEIIKKDYSIDLLKETWATGTVLKANASGKFFGTYLAPRKDIDGLNILYKVHGIGDDGLGYRYFTGAKKETATKGKFYSGVPSERKIELEMGASVKEKPILNFYDFADAFGNCRHEGNVDFRNGKKPIAFLMKLINQSIHGDKNEIVLDFFAGSGSTAHAVMQLNAEDGGNRQFICVQLPEATDKKSEAFKAGYHSIFDITKARIEKSAVKIQQDFPNYQGDLGFKIFETVPNFRLAQEDENLSPQQPLPDMLNANLNEEQYHSLLTTWRGFDGNALTDPVQAVKLGDYVANLCGHTLYFIQAGFDSLAIKALIEKLDKDKAFLPERIVLFGANVESAKQKELKQALDSYTNRKKLNIALLVRY